MIVFLSTDEYLGGSLTRQTERDESLSECATHILHIGKMIEVRRPIYMPSMG